MNKVYYSEIERLKNESGELDDEEREHVEDSFKMIHEKIRETIAF